MSPASPEDAGPPELPGYCFLRRIGAGGNAQVYLYEQELPSRKVAVKVLNDSALSAAARRQFVTEANVTAVLAHRHIVQVFDAKVTDDGRPYIVMPFYPQPNLFVRARRAHFSVAQVLRIGIQIGSAVETSHRNGVLHRDIKPQNILTDSYGEPALTDFGIATTRPGDGPAGLSVPWSPPEIVFGTGPGDRRSDVYSLGATLWHLLAGRPPFEQPGGGSTGELRDRINSAPPPRTPRTDVPDSLERLLRQAMAKDPAARPQSAMELIRALQSIEQELRLPLTHPILPADEPAHGDTRDHDTVARPAASAGGSTFSREQAAAVIDSPPADQEQPAGLMEDTGAPGTGGAASQPRHADSRTHAEEQKQQVRPAYGQRAGPRRDEPAWNGDTQDLTSPRGSQPKTPGQAAADLARATERSRAPTVPGPPPTTGISEPAVGAAVPARMPVVLDPSGRVASFAADRDVAASPGKSRRIRGWVLAFAGGGGLLVAVTAVIVFALQHGNGNQSHALTGAGQATPPGIDENALAPGQPVVTASRVNAGQVEFQWTYSNSAAGDTFRWQELIAGTGERDGLATKPDLLLTVTKGRRACLTVTVRSAEGEASKPSNRVCSPE